MKYFLDFDGVIFDIKAFKARMETLGFKDAPRNAALFASIEEADPSFSVESFVFEDARAFLNEHKEDCFVVSSYISSNPLFNQNEKEAASYQEEKIARAKVTELLGRERIHVVGESKREVLIALQEQYALGNGSCIFIDDTEEHVKDALQIGMNAILMARQAQEVPEVLCVASFTELPLYT